MSKDYRKSIVRNYERLFARGNIKRLSEKDKKSLKIIYLLKMSILINLIKDLMNYINPTMRILI